MLVAHFACNQAQHTEEVFDVDEKATKVMLKGESTCGAGRASGPDDAYMVLGDYRFIAARLNGRTLNVCDFGADFVVLPRL